MKAFKGFIISLLLLCSCDNPGVPHSESEKKKMLNEVINYHLTILSEGLEYYKDTRTNLCYSGMGIGYFAATLTNVPCSEEVEKIAHLFRSQR